MLKHSKWVVILFITILSSSFSFGQLDRTEKSYEPTFQKGLHALKQGDTLTAFQYFQSVYTVAPKQADVNYYYIMLSLVLNKPYAADIANQWIAGSANRIYSARLNYYLGRFYYSKQQASACLNAYSKVTIDDLENTEIGLMKFEQSYLYFKNGDWDKAVDLLNNIRQVKSSPHYFDANYYAGFIALQRKDYKLAMECFTIASEQNSYKTLTPFYISQIYYLLGDIDAAMNNCETALKAGNQFYKADLEQLLGHLLFDKKQYARALPYLENFVSGKKEIDFQDLYQLSFCYFEAAQWDKAINGFKKLANAEDSLGQNSMYLLATCYLKVDNKLGAKNAFLLCATKSQNLAQKEVSLFNYAKLSAALKDYSTAVSTLDKFIISYPNSIYVEEAKSLWITSLTYSNNFIQALEAYQSIESPSAELLKVYPSILYGRACLYLNDGQVDNAFSLFEKIANTPYNTKVLTLSQFWLGELAYKLGRVQESILNLEAYLQNPITSNEVSVAHANYTLGYSYLKLGGYQKALTHFNNVIDNTAIIHFDTYQKDAFTRIADCQMMQKQLKPALQAYQKIIDLDWINRDYATLQKSILLGGLGKPKDKINILKDYTDNFPHSAFINDARFELADTYVSQEDFQSAIAPLSQVLLEKDATSFYPQAYYKLGIVYFNLDKNEMALSTFNDLFKEYPNSVESDNSVEFVRNIYVENQTPELFVQFMNQNNKPLSTNEQDSLIFRSAMLKYEQKKYSESALGFSKYLALFPLGKHQIEAIYLNAEIAYAALQYDSAANYFAKVADQYTNQYAERSALVAARLFYFNFKQYEKAEKYFNLLLQIATQQENKTEASRGLLRCQYKLEQWAACAPTATLILEDKSSAVDDLLMANMVLYHKSILSGDTLNAIAILNKVIKFSTATYTAEAHYNLAKIYYDQAKYTLAEKTAFEMIKKQASFEYWVTKAYILLGDIYIGQKDNFNAIATYKSVSENANFDDLKQIAADKLSLLQSADQNNLK